MVARYPEGVLFVFLANYGMDIKWFTRLDNLSKLDSTHSSHVNGIFPGGSNNISNYF